MQGKIKSQDKKFWQYNVAYSIILTITTNNKNYQIMKNYWRKIFKGLHSKTYKMKKA